MGQHVSCTAEAPVLLRALQHGQVDVIAGLICNNPALARHGFQGSNNTIWHCAALRGDLKVLKTLVEVMQTVVVRHRDFKIDQSGVHQCVAIFLNQRNADGQTPLMLACDAGFTQFCQYLMVKGASPWAHDRQRGRTCIHYAASKGHADCIDVVSTYVQAQGGDQDVARLMNFSDFGGFSPLHCAVWCEQMGAVHTLCGWGSYLPARVDWEVLGGSDCNPGSTPLHLAALRGNLDLAVALLHYQEARRHQQQQREACSTQSSAATVHAPAEQMDTRAIPDNLCQLPFSIALHRNHHHLLHVLHPLLPLPPVHPSLSMPSSPETTIAPLGSPHAPSAQLRNQVKQLETQLQSGSVSVPGSTQPAGELVHPRTSAHSHRTFPAQDGAAFACTTQYDVPDAVRGKAEYDVLAVEARLLRIGASSDLSDDSCTSSLQGSRSATESSAGPPGEDKPGWEIGCAGGGLVPRLGLQLGLGEVQGRGLGVAGGLLWSDGLGSAAAAAAAAAEQRGREVECTVEEVLQQLVAEVVGTEQASSLQRCRGPQMATPPTPSLLAELVASAEGSGSSPRAAESVSLPTPFAAAASANQGRSSIDRGRQHQFGQSWRTPSTVVPSLRPTLAAVPPIRHKGTAQRTRHVTASIQQLSSSTAVTPERPSTADHSCRRVSASSQEPLALLLQQQAAVTLDLCRIYRLLHGIGPGVAPAYQPQLSADLGLPADQDVAVIQAAAAVASLLPPKSHRPQGLRRLVPRLSARHAARHHKAALPTLQVQGDTATCPPAALRIKGWVHGQGDSAAVSEAITRASKALLYEVGRWQESSAAVDCSAAQQTACGVCLQPICGQVVMLQVEPCAHQMCVDCSWELASMQPGFPPTCPFCHDGVSSFGSPTWLPLPNSWGKPGRNAEDAAMDAAGK